MASISVRLAILSTCYSAGEDLNKNDDDDDGDDDGGDDAAGDGSDGDDDDSMMMMIVMVMMLATSTNRHSTYSDYPLNCGTNLVDNIRDQ